MFAGYARIVIRLRYLLLPCLLGLLGYAIAQLPKLKFNTSIHPLLEASKGQRSAVRNFDKALPPMRAHLLCSVDWPQVIGQAELDDLGEFETRAREHKAIRRTISLASVPVVGRKFGIPVPSRFRDEHPDETARARVKKHPIFDHWLLSEDGKAAVVLVYLGKRARTTGAMEHLRAVAPPGAALHFFAGRMVSQAMRRTMIRDLRRGMIVELICVAVALGFLFRTFRGVLISLSAPGAAVVFFLGLSTRLGSISLIEIAVPGLLLVIGLCDAVHLVCAFEETRREVADRHEAVVQTMAHVGSACLWTSFTTALGFLSLLTADHAAVRDLALTAAVGVGIAFLTVVTVVPLLLALWPARKPAPTVFWVARVTRALGAPAGRVAALGFLALSLVGLTRLTVNSRWIEELPPSNEVARELHWYEDRIGGLLSIELHVRGPLDAPGSIRAIEALQRTVCQEDGVTRAESYTLWVREILTGNPGATDTQLRAAVAMLKGVGELFPRHLLTPDFSEGRVCFSARDMSTQRYLHLKDVLDREAAKLPAHLTAEVAGYERMAHESSRLVVTTMLRGFVLTLVSVCVLIGLIFRSWRVGLISVFPNAIPILCGLGVAGWLGIDLRIGVVMVFCVGVGLAVDDTIHLLSRFVLESRRNPSAPVGDRVSAALGVTGNALFVTSAVLLFGALCHLPAEFRSLRDTGAILATIVTVAYIADIAFLPRLMTRFLGNERWGEKPAPPVAGRPPRTP
jgi:uncharacterized protein